jgi:hypothetical protein
MASQNTEQIRGGLDNTCNRPSMASSAVAETARSRMSAARKCQTFHNRSIRAPLAKRHSRMRRYGMPLSREVSRCLKGRAIPTTL